MDKRQKHPAAGNTGLPRALEAALAGGALIMLSPVILPAALLVRLTSRGPAFFRQQRVGLNGREFTFYKLRTMRACRRGGAAGPKVTAKGDSRVTPVGKFLRQTKLDELPELWNVVKGDLALVGPRPEVPELVDRQDPLWRKILEIKPGITDPVTLMLRHEEDLLASVGEDREKFYQETLQPLKMRGYLRYAEGRSWKSDFWVLVKTLGAIVMPPKESAIDPKEVLKTFRDAEITSK